MQFLILSPFCLVFTAPNERNPFLHSLQRPGMPPSSRMTPQGPAMGPPGYGNSPVSRPVMPGVMDPSRKRPAPQQIQQVQQQNRNQQ